MSSEPGRQIRVTVPLEVFERITRTADALGVSANELGARCVVAGIDDAIESRIGELERMLVALRGEVAPPPPDSEAFNDAVARAKTENGAEPPPPETRFKTSDDAKARFQGRAEKAAAVRAEALAEERRRRPGSV